MQNYYKLIARLADISQLRRASALLSWDHVTYMPPGGAGARAAQLTVLRRLSHEQFASAQTGELLAGAENECSGLEEHSRERLTLRVVRREYDKAVKLPISLVAELAHATAVGHQTWVKSREESNYSLFAPTLTHLLDLMRQKAEAYGYEERAYDALLDIYEPGMKTHEVEAVFDELRPGLVELVQAIGAAEQVDDSPLRRDFDKEGQQLFGELIAARLGYDFQRGRLDETVHPFCTSFSRNDVRITTRYERNWLPAALMGTIHETGHALYEQGYDPADDDTPLQRAASSGVHESQSRLWENIICRSRGFWSNYYAELQRHFPGVLDDVSLDSFYRAINRVQPSMIRVEADEVTYCLHIMLRFEMEKGLLDGSIAVADVPEVWNQKMRDYLGITPPNDSQGCLQDVHWSGASFGYFPTYALGTILSAQLFDKALADVPGLETAMAGGDYSGLLGWLREKIHRQGARWLPAELVQRACGEPAQSHSYLRYLRAKFSDVYGLSASALGAGG